MESQIFIVGAGGFGREVYKWAWDRWFSCPEGGGEGYSFGGFLDSNAQALDRFDYPVGVVGDPVSWRVEPQQRFLLGVGMPRVKRSITAPLLAQGAEFLTLVHPSATVGMHVKFGQGCVVCPGALLTCDIVIGDFVVMNLGCTVGHDATIGAWSTLSPHADVTGHVRLGEGVFLGSHASVTPGNCVGDEATIGAGSVAFRTVPAHVTVLGVPAHRLI